MEGQLTIHFAWVPGAGMAQAKQNSYSYFKVATYIQAQQTGAKQQPEQPHHWSEAAGRARQLEERKDTTQSLAYSLSNNDF